MNINAIVTNVQLKQLMCDNDLGRNNKPHFPLTGFQLYEPLFLMPYLGNAKIYSNNTTIIIIIIIPIITAEEL
jgi:hypothetical protein